MFMELLAYKKSEETVSDTTKFARNNLASIYLFIVSNKNTIKRCELICSKLTIKTPARR